MESIAWFHVPSVCCVIANVSAGSYVNGSDATCSAIGAAGFATSVTDRNLIGADAWSRSHEIGNAIGGDGGTAAEVSGVADDGTDAGEGLEDGEVGGRVTKVARSEPEYPAS
jgi:hypothetical protein